MHLLIMAVRALLTSHMQRTVSRVRKNAGWEQQVEEVSFRSPVSIGDLLRFQSHVAHTVRRHNDPTTVRGWRMVDMHITTIAFSGESALLNLTC